MISGSRWFLYTVVASFGFRGSVAPPASVRRLSSPESGGSDSIIFRRLLPVSDLCFCSLFAQSTLDLRLHVGCSWIDRRRLFFGSVDLWFVLLRGCSCWSASLRIWWVWGRSLIAVGGDFVWVVGFMVRGSFRWFFGERRWLRRGISIRWRWRCRQHVFLIGEESNTCFGFVIWTTRAWGKPSGLRMLGLWRRVLGRRFRFNVCLGLTRMFSLVCPLGLCDIWFLGFGPSIIIIDGKKKYTGRGFYVFL